jgi:hypothetical protein
MPFYKQVGHASHQPIDERAKAYWFQPFPLLFPPIYIFYSFLNASPSFIHPYIYPIPLFSAPLYI